MKLKIGTNNTPPENMSNTTQTATITITFDGETLKVTPEFNPPIDMNAQVDPNNVNPVTALAMTAMMAIQQTMKMAQQDDPEKN